MNKIEINDLLVDNSGSGWSQLSLEEQAGVFGGGIPQVVPCTSDLPPGHWGSPCVGSSGGRIEAFTWYTKIA